MNLPLSKKPLEKAGQSDIGQALQTAARSTLVTALGGQPANGAAGNGGPIKSSKPLGWAAKPVLIVAGGVAGMTAASAAVSAVRRAQGDD